MSVGMMQNIELILTVGISFVVGIAYGVWLANDIRNQSDEIMDWVRKEWMKWK